jgi:hypothetical protein
MTLAIFGAGLPRTGTLSLKRAVEDLGFGPCFHPVDASDAAAIEVVFKTALNGCPINWDLVFDGYNAAFDVPASYFYRDLMDKYPHAKVILTVREDVDAWYFSYRKLKELLRSTSGDPFWWAREDNSTAVFGESIVRMSLSDNRSEITAAHRRYNREVVATTSPDRLLVFDVKSGWDSLCRFLGAPTPSHPFPAVNSIQDLASYFSHS